MNNYFKVVKMPRKRKSIRQVQRELKRRRRLKQQKLMLRYPRAYQRVRRIARPIARVFPKSFKVQLTAVKDLYIKTYSQGGTVIAMNSINPFIKTGSEDYSASQARGFDEWEALYRKYCIVGATLHIDPQYRVYTQQLADGSGGDGDDPVVTGTNTVPETIGGDQDDYQLSYTRQMSSKTRTTKPVEMILIDADQSADIEYNIATMMEQGEKFKKTTIHNDLGNHHAKGRGLFHKFGVYKSFGLKRKDALFNIEQSPDLQAEIDTALQRPDRVWGTCATHNGQGSLVNSATPPGKIKFAHIQLHTGGKPSMDPEPSNNSVLCRLTLRQTVVFFDKKTINNSTTAI